MNLLNSKVDDKKKRIKIVPDFDTLQKLTDALDESLPICIIGCTGLVGAGKSTLMNLLALHIDPTINSKDLFQAGQGCSSTTEGCQVFLAKKLVYGGAQIILMDFEGFGGIRNNHPNLKGPAQYQKFLEKIIFFNFILSSALVVCCNLRMTEIEESLYQELEKQFSINQKENLNHPHTVKAFFKDGFRMNKGSDQEIQKNEDQYKKILFECSPTFFNKVDIVKMPRIDDFVLDFKEKIQFEEIDKFLKCINLAKLPKKQQFIKLINDIFCIINEEQNEKAFAQQQRSYYVFESFIPHYNNLNIKTELLADQCLKSTQSEENFVKIFMCYEREFMELFNEELVKHRIYLEPIVKKNQEQIRKLFNPDRAKKFYSLRLKGAKSNNKTILENIVDGTVNNFWSILESYYFKLINKSNLPTLKQIQQNNNQ